MASVVGRFLSECLAARELYVAAKECRINECSPKWLRGRTEKLNSMKTYILHLVTSRLHSTCPQPTYDCAVTLTWVANHSNQHIHRAFRPIRLWLADNWDFQVDRSHKRKAKSVALF